MEKPLVSILLPAYMQENYIRQSLESALAQTYSPLEIIVSDDCSTDNTYGIISEITKSYRGPHKLTVNQNKRNLGIVDHLELIRSWAKGELFVVCAGDDISFPFRVEIIVKEWLDSGKKYASIFSNSEIIDEDGVSHGECFEGIPAYTSTINEYESSYSSILKHLYNPEVWYIGATSASIPDVFKKFSKMDGRAKQEDAILSFRSLLLGGILYIAQPLIQYRQHSKSISSTSNIDSRIKLIKNEYFYYRVQCRDAKSFHTSNKVLVKVHLYKYISFVKRIIFSIPIVNKYILRAALAIKQR